MLSDASPTRNSAVPKDNYTGQYPDSTYLRVRMLPRCGGRRCVEGQSRGPNFLAKALLGLSHYLYHPDSSANLVTFAVIPEEIPVLSVCRIISH